MRIRFSGLKWIVVLKWLATTLGLLLAANISHAGLVPPNSDELVFAGVPITFPEDQTQRLPAFAGPFIAPDQKVQLFEDASLTILSDEIYLVAQFLYFASDPDFFTGDGFDTAIVKATIQEDGTLQDVGKYFVDNNNMPLFGNNVLLVSSDVQTVPEPTTLTQMAIGAFLLLVMIQLRTCGSRLVAART